MPKNTHLPLNKIIIKLNKNRAVVMSLNLEDDAR